MQKIRVRKVSNFVAGCCWLSIRIAVGSVWVTDQRVVVKIVALVAAVAKWGMIRVE